MISSHRTDTATLLPSTFITAFMRALNLGTWLLNCMNSKFFDNGMAAFFNVQNCSKRMDLPLAVGRQESITLQPKTSFGITGQLVKITSTECH